MVWRKLVEKVSSACTFAPPASKEELPEAEAALGINLPPELRALLLESNGIRDQYGDGVMSVSKMVSINLEMQREFRASDLYMPFDHLLFFAAMGDGDLFFFPIQSNGKINNPDIFVWSHETDSRQWNNNNLEQFIQKWFGGHL